MQFLQRLGKSIMLPVAALPVPAILAGVSSWIEGASGSKNLVSIFLGAAGAALLNNENAQIEFSE